MPPSIPQVFAPFTDGFFATGDQVHAWVMRRAEAELARHDERRAKLRTPAEVRAWQAEVRAAFLRSIGGLPDGDRGPPPVQETGVLQREGHRIHKLVFDSLPGMPVAAQIFRPDTAAGRRPGILMLCGHNNAGLAAPLYQQVCVDLVGAGFVVLILDAPGLGEMMQCLDTDGRPLVGYTVMEHMHVQGPAWIINRNIARYFTWNTLRALDLLCAQPDVDAARIGVTGNSGGGTQTQYLMLCDERPIAAMPCCSLSSRASYLATGSRAYDGEQNLFGCIPTGLDYADFLAACAPRPLRIGAAEHDYFCIEAVEETCERVRAVYTTLGAQDRFDLVIAQGQAHGFSPPLRESCVNFFRRQLLGLPEDFRTGDPPVAEALQLRCTPTGQVLTARPDARSMTAFIAADWRTVRASTPPPTRDEIRRWLALPGPNRIRPRRTARTAAEGVIGERFCFFAEPDIMLTAACYRAEADPAYATILLLPDSTCGQTPWQELIAGLVAAGHLVIVPDLRGIGAVAMHQRNRATGHQPKSTEFRNASDLFMLGTSQVALRTADLLRQVDHLRLRPEPCARQPVGLFAAGGPAIYGMCAAAVDDAFGPCLFHGCLASWDDAFAGGRRDHDLFSEAFLAPEFAGRVDIPDLLRLAGREGARKVALADPRRADGSPASTIPRLPDISTATMIAFLTPTARLEHHP